MNDEKYKVKWTGAFKKDYKLIQKRGYDTDVLVLSLTRTGTHSDLFSK